MFSKNVGVCRVFWVNPERLVFHVVILEDLETIPGAFASA